jgi:hypothetical protein
MAKILAESKSMFNYTTQVNALDLSNTKEFPVTITSEKEK